MQVDLISFNGPTFKNWDNRVAALRLVQKNLCDAALFDPSGDSPQLFFSLFQITTCVQPQHLCKPYALHHGDINPMSYRVLLCRGAADSSRDAVQEERTAHERALQAIHPPT